MNIAAAPSRYILLKNFSLTHNVIYKHDNQFSNDSSLLFEVKWQIDEGSEVNDALDHPVS